jgi:hypothetical protein
MVDHLPHDPHEVMDLLTPDPPRPIRVLCVRKFSGIYVFYTQLSIQNLRYVSHDL